jgi:transposase InsO family protein
MTNITAPEDRNPQRDVPEPEAGRPPERAEPNPETREPDRKPWEPAIPALAGRGRNCRGKRLVKKSEEPRKTVTPEQKLLLLDTWKRSGLPAKDFGALVGVATFTLYSWKKKFDDMGPAGLMERVKRTRKGSRLPELTRRTILMLKQGNPEYGCQRISDMLARGPALPASPGAVARVLKEAGYETEEIATRPHPDKVRSFERAKPNQMWQTDLFTFVLKRQNRRVHMVAFMDDHSRFVVSYGVWASPSTALVLEVFRAGIASHHRPEEVMTDNGPQYVTWRGKSAFAKELEKQGIKQIVATPRRPQTLGKIERFWGTLWRECLETAVFIDLDDSRRRIGHFIDHYNFQRPHQGIGGLVPADRFYQAAPDVRKVLQARVAANAMDLARDGVLKEPFYLTGRTSEGGFSVHSEGDKVYMMNEQGERKEIDLGTNPDIKPMPIPEPLSVQGVPESLDDEEGNEEPPAPGTSPIDELVVLPEPEEEERAPR